jgi:hypothetical protein
MWGLMALAGCGEMDKGADGVEVRTGAQTLAAPWALYSGDSLYSDNTLYRLTMQSDCNLVLYTPNAIWSTNTWGRGTNCYATMQTDGNFVLYSGTNKALWSSNTWGHPGAYLDLQVDRNLVVYDKNRHALWSTDTWIRPPAGCYYAPPPCPGAPNTCVVQVCGSQRTLLYCPPSCTQ